MPGESRRVAALLAFLVVVGFGLSLFAGIFLDDATNLFHAYDADWNLRSLGRAFRFDLHEMHDGVVPPYLATGPMYFRPLTVAMVKVETAVFGTSWWGYHLVNVVLEVLVVLLLFRFAAVLLEDRVQAFRAAVLFTFCFINVITVTWLSTRGDLLCGLFSLLGLVAVQSGGPGASGKSVRLAWMTSQVSFLLALLAKETGAALPLLVGSFVFWRERERGVSIKFAAARVLAWSGPMLFLLAGYFWVRHQILGGFIIPDYYFYFFSPTSWLFPYYVVQKLIYSVLALICFFPPVHIKLLMGIPVYNVLFACLATLVLIVGFRFLLPRWESDPIYRLLVPCFFFSFLPTLPILLLPHYFFLPSMFYCILLARFLWGTTPPPAALLAWPQGLLKRIYLALYGAAFLLSLVIIISFFRWTSIHSERICQALKQAYDEHSVRAAMTPGEKSPAELYLVDVQGPMVHAFVEFKFRFPTRRNFQGFFVNVLAPAAPPSEITFLPNRLLVRSRFRRPFYSGPFFLAIFGPVDPEDLKRKYFSPFFCQYATELELADPTGNLGIRELALDFDPQRSRPAARYFLRGNCPPSSVPLRLRGS